VPAPDPNNIAAAQITKAKHLWDTCTKECKLLILVWETPKKQILAAAPSLHLQVLEDSATTTRACGG